MTMVRDKIFSQEEDTSVRDKWEHTLEDLAVQISEWARSEPDWRVDHTHYSNITEETLGTYDAPVVTIYMPNGRLIAEPIARNFPGRGIVDFMHGRRCFV